VKLAVAGAGGRMGRTLIEMILRSEDLKLAGALRGRVLFLEAEALISRTADALQRTAAMLELNEPLQADYRRFAHTGESGFGDPSEAISTGRISNAVREPRTPVMLPAALAARLETVYDICSASLRERCDGSSRDCGMVGGPSSLHEP